MRLRIEISELAVICGLALTVLAGPVFAVEPQSEQQASATDDPERSQLEIVHQKQDSSGFRDRPTRVILMPTAFELEPRRVRLVFRNVLQFEVSGAVNRHIEIGVQGTIPVPSFAVAPRIKAVKQFSKYVHGGLFGGVGYFFLERDNGAFLYGGGPVLTIGEPAFFLNLSAPVLGVMSYFPCHSEGDCAGLMDPFTILLPNAALSLALGRVARLSAEFYMISDFDFKGLSTAILYGIGFPSENFLLDLSFLLLISNLGENVTPFGLPMLSVGFRF